MLPYGCSSNDEVLLLLRSSKHNDSTWGLPGGNVELGDDNLKVTAKREATEELGHLPSFTIDNKILTKWGSCPQRKPQQGLHQVSEGVRLTATD